MGASASSGHERSGSVDGEEIYEREELILDNRDVQMDGDKNPWIPCNFRLKQGELVAFAPNGDVVFLVNLITDDVNYKVEHNDQLYYLNIKLNKAIKPINANIKAKDKEEAHDFLKLIRFQIIGCLKSRQDMKPKPAKLTKQAGKKNLIEPDEEETDTRALIGRMSDVFFNSIQEDESEKRHHPHKTDSPRIIVPMKKMIIQPPNINIVILVVGTRGDVQPFIYLGQRLLQDGHRVRSVHIVSNLYCLFCFA
jgi:hypothetical protein